MRPSLTGFITPFFRPPFLCGSFLFVPQKPSKINIYIYLTPSHRSLGSRREDTLGQRVPRPHMSRALSLFLLSQLLVTVFIINAVTALILPNDVVGNDHWAWQPAPYAALSAGPRKVYSHYFLPYPLSLDNLPPSVDYYDRNYVNNYLGEGGGGVFRNGGFLRERPLKTTPLINVSLTPDWTTANFEREIRRAMLAGLDGFAVDILGLDPTPGPGSRTCLSYPLHSSSSLSLTSKLRCSQCPWAPQRRSECEFDLSNHSPARHDDLVIELKRPYHLPWHLPQAPLCCDLQRKGAHSFLPYLLNFLKISFVSYFFDLAHHIPLLRAASQRLMVGSSSFYPKLDLLRRCGLHGLLCQHLHTVSSF